MTADAIKRDNNIKGCFYVPSIHSCHKEPRLTSGYTKGLRNHKNRAFYFFFQVSTELINFRKHHHAHNKHFSFSGDALRKEQPTRWNGCGRNPKRIWSAWRTSWPLWELAGPSSPGSQTALLPTHAPTPGTCQSNRHNNECRILNLNSDLKTVLPYLLMPNFTESSAQTSFFCDFNLCEF